MVPAVAVMLLRHRGLLVGAFIGLALVVAGGWWLVTERMPRRPIWVAGPVSGRPRSPSP